MDLEKFTDAEQKEMVRGVVMALIDSIDLDKFQKSFHEHYHTDYAEEVLAEVMNQLSDRKAMYEQCGQFFDALDVVDDPPEESEEG